MFNRNRLDELVKKMFDHAITHYDTLVQLKSVDEEAETFVLEIRGDRYSLEEAPWEAYKWSCTEEQLMFGQRELGRELITLEIPNDPDGWLMEADPRLMFAAMYSG